MQKALFATTALAVAGFSAVAGAVDVELYGQVNKGVMFADDGNDNHFNVVDNDFSSTRLGVKGSQQLDNGLTASVLLEMEMQSNPSDVETQNTELTGTTDGTTDFAERVARVGIAGDWGAVFVGQMHTASNRVTEQDLAGAGDVLGSDIEDIGGGYIIQGLGTSIAANTDNMDGNGRTDAVRYDSPIFNGLQGRVSVAQGGDMDLGLFYEGAYDAFKIAAALGYVAFNDNGTANPTNNIESQISGSVSVKHDSGLGATFAYGQQEVENAGAGIEEPEFYYFKLGYTFDAFEVAADFSNHSDIVVADANETEVDYFGIAGQYNLGNGVSAAVYYKNFEYSETGIDAEDISVYGVNMRVKF